MMILVGGIGGWLWYTAQTAVQHGQANPTVQVAHEAAASTTPVHRQTQSHRQTAEDWQRTAPDAALWSPVRSLETPSLIFHFRQNDATAIISVAPQVEEIYTTIRRNFGLPIKPGAEKLVIDVSVTQPPGFIYSWIRLPGGPRGLRVPSPSLYRAPVELIDAELLAQSIVLPMFAHLLPEVIDYHQIGMGWQPMVSSLELWQLWDLDLPLSNWRDEVVQWVYVDLPAAKLGETIPLPGRYTALCAAHKLWMRSPLQIHVPLLCVQLGHEEEYYPQWEARNPPLRLDELAAPFDSEYSSAATTNRVVHAGRIVALTTLVDYAVATYGRERLPTLVAGLGQHANCDTLIPAVYGVSPAEFEVGWQAYLAAHYGVPKH
jgi:hypothetical protein